VIHAIGGLASRYCDGPRSDPIHRRTAHVLPGRGLRRRRIPALRAAADNVWVSRRFKTAFHSPAATAAFAATSAGSKFPACPITVLPLYGTFVPSKRCEPRTRHSPAPRVFAPLWELPLPPDHRSPRFAARKLALPDARCPYLLARAAFQPADTDLRTGFAAPGLARRLCEPLGTSTILH
jgi:hypothetical protein